MTLRIDVHHHIHPSSFAAASNQEGGRPVEWYIAENALKTSRELCQRLKIDAAILSVTPPAAECRTDLVEAAALARYMNECHAKIRDRDPSHYGFFACVPSLLDRERCIAEICYALDNLQADGICLMTRYGTDNHYLGHKDFTPIWQELNRRKAVVFVHPCHGTDTAPLNDILSRPMYDFPHETSRAAIDLITSNMLRDHAKDCKIVLSHAGGTLPLLVGRAAGWLGFSDGNKSAGEIMDEASWFYYDTALSGRDEQLAALRLVAKPGHILYGSDAPNVPAGTMEYFSTHLESSSLLTEVEKEDIWSGTAMKLFPRLAGKMARAEPL